MNNGMSSYKYNSVLLIDDNTLDNFINETVMKSVGFSQNIHTYTSAISALNFLKILNGSGHEYPQVIFIDINMPLMNGFEFIQKLKTMPDTALQKAKLVILTSSVNEEDKETAKNISTEIAFISKPLSKEKLECFL
jgi:CheY-like chemotaxis protein